MIQHLAQRPISALRSLLTHEASGGLILIASGAIALIVANSPAAELYSTTLARDVFGISVLHWINAVMAVFFFLVGLEIKREFVRGDFGRWPRRVLPACGGRRDDGARADLAALNPGLPRPCAAGRFPRRPTSCSRSASSR